MARRVLAFFCLLALYSSAPLMAADTIHLSVDASKPGAKIDRNLFGQFAENLGHGLYEGIWVGPDSPIPNTRGIRNDVVAASEGAEGAQRPLAGRLLCRRVPLAQGNRPSGDQRPATVNSAWGDVVDTNAFGTDEFMDFIQQIGSQAYVSVNVGSGTPQEAAEWLEYMTAAAAHGAGQRAGRQRPSRSLQGRFPRHRKRELGLWRQHDGGLLSEPTQDLQPLRQELESCAASSRTRCSRSLSARALPETGGPRPS